MHVVQPLLMLFGILIQPGGNSIILFDCRFSGTEPKQLGVCNFFFHLLYVLLSQDTHELVYQ